MAKAGKPEHVPNDGTREAVKALSRFGIRQDEIGPYLGIDPKTLRKHYRHELDFGALDANMNVVSALYNSAVGGNNVKAQIFWAKTRCGFKETMGIEHSEKEKGKNLDDFYADMQPDDEE